MASRTAQSKEITYEEPFWRSPAVKIMVVAILGVGSILGIQKLERINMRHQVENRLSRDPALGPMLVKWREAIANNQKVQAHPGDQLPTALYFGQVEEFVETKPVITGLSASRLLKLKQPQLLAGVGGKYDSIKNVDIAFTNHPMGVNKPKPGEEWLVAVWRDKEDKNFVHTAYRCEPLKE
jgi:hypothetical protein